MSKQRKPKPIGPVPVTVPGRVPRPERRIEDDEEPFKVDRNSPNQQIMAKHLGCKRLYEIEKAEHDAWEQAKLL